MATYDVKTGMNLGVDSMRFEPGDAISDAELNGFRVSKKTKKWLLDEGHLEKRGAASSSGSDPDNDDSEDPSGEDE